MENCCSTGYSALIQFFQKVHTVLVQRGPWSLCWLFSKGFAQTSRMVKTMKPIFLSRPSWVPEKYRPGLDHFQTLLREQHLDPRSVGVTDYPSNAPMDEVIRLMKQCAGAIILGVPQIEVKTGVLKGNAIDEPFSLGTEWNHIEAALAYALELPTLVIHHQTVVRGVFDRGATQSFLHEVDFSCPTWALTERIVGAVRTWRGRLQT